jgi:hypothetical protein
MDDIFRVTKDASGNPVYTHNNEVLTKDVFDQRNTKSTAEMNALKNQKDDFDSEFDDIRAKTLAIKKPIKKAKGGEINLSNCKVNTAQKNSSNSRW